ncbi:MAG: hypothetical protein Q4A78_08775 [Peptostreptococcaceae bacterium]|nr:hypothetical protein [Peptostreptococcaceae bacterium]
MNEKGIDEKRGKERIYEEIVNIKIKEQREGCHEKSGSIVWVR